ncbi:restriction endonuclease subunit S [Kribbella sp. CA-253562]|uniref:restriction endonuclease subunit S n=1 Tax=Kribbella sp. CA-253562 TaxID=3239942 RepID=UPI003D8DC42C
MTENAEELPLGWTRRRVGDVLKLQNGYAFKASEWSQSGIPIIRIQNLKSGSARHNYYEGSLPDRFRAEPGDLLFAWSGTPGTSFGAHVWNGPEAWINQHIFRVDFSSEDFDRDFLKLALDFNLNEYISGAQGGVGLAHITKGKLNESHLITPPLAVQHQLAVRVAKIAEGRASALKHLAQAQRAIERFRRSVLAAASLGRLTADWREEHKGGVDELVKSLRKTGRRRPPTEPQADLIDELQADWEIVTLDLLIDHIEAGKSFSALGRPADPDEWGVIKVSAMSWGSFLEDENKAVPDGRHINPDFEVRSGDLLLSRANTADLVGATVLVGEIRPRLLLSDKSLRLVPRAGIEAPWLNYVLSSPLVRGQFSERATGTSDSMRNLSQAKILSTTLALPPTEEQKEIWRRVDELFKAANILERRIAAAVLRVERSPQAVLAKAFRGDLTQVGHEL